MPKNKVKFGLKNVHYALATINPEDNTATYGEVKRIPGAVNLSLETQGDPVRFYADDAVYFSAPANSGYEGNLELALVPDEFRTEVLGEVADKNGALVENAGAVCKPFALLFEFTGDQHGRRHCMYNCTATRPSVASTTKGESLEVQTETISIIAAPIHIAALDIDTPKVSCEADSETAYKTWFESVYEPVAPEAV